MKRRNIKLRIQEESDLYSPLDPDQNMLSEEVAGYLTRVFLSKHRQFTEEYVIEIISDTPLDEDHARQTIRREFETQKDDTAFALKQLTLKEVLLAVIGVVILSVWLYFAATAENVRVEILSIMGWVCIWEATSIMLMQRPELLRMYKNLDRLFKAEIRFSTAGDQKDVTDQS